MAADWNLTTVSATIPGKDKLNAFYSGISGGGALTQGLNQLGTATDLLQDALELIDLPLPLKMMMFRLKKHDGSTAPIPELILRINPDSFSVSYKKKSDLVYTTGGFVTQHWHDDRMTIKASGWVPSFKGRAKILTDGYQMFLQLLDIYRSCGSVQKFLGQKLLSKNLEINSFLEKYTDTQAGKTSSSAVSQDTKDRQPTTYEALTMYPKVELFYQNDVYEGIFTDFTAKENYEMPNTLQYDFTFIADKRTDTIWGGLASGVGGVLGATSRVLRPFSSFSGPRLK